MSGRAEQRPQYGHTSRAPWLHLSELCMWRWREESTGAPKPSVVKTNVAQSAGSEALLAEVGLMASSHDMGFQKSSRALALSACSSRIHLFSKSGVLDRGLVFLGEVKLALLLKSRADVSLT